MSSLYDNERGEPGWALDLRDIRLINSIVNIQTKPDIQTYVVAFAPLGPEAAVVGGGPELARQQLLRAGRLGGETYT